MDRLRIETLSGRFGVARLSPQSAVPAWANQELTFVSIAKSEHELSVVAPIEAIPQGIVSEGPFVAMRIFGTLDFGLVGILAILTGALANAGIPVFVISTFDTDYLLVRSNDIETAHEALASVADLV